MENVYYLLLLPQLLQLHIFVSAADKCMALQTQIYSFTLHLETFSAVPRPIGTSRGDI